MDLGAADGEVVVSCGSGVTACHTALAMRVAGLPDPLLYAGSYSDWVTAAGLPVVIGSEPTVAPQRRRCSAMMRSLMTTYAQMCCPMCRPAEPGTMDARAAR